MRAKTIIFDEIKNKGRHYILLKFNFDKDIHKILMGLGCEYNSTKTNYQILNTPSNYKLLIDVLGKLYKLDLYELKKRYLDRKVNKAPLREVMELNEKGRDWYLRYDRYLSSKRYSEQTIKSYLFSVKQFLAYYSGKDPLDIGNEDVNFYIHNYIVPKGYSISVQRQLVSAIKLFFDYAKGDKMDVEKLVSPQKSNTLPKLLAVSEIKKMLEVSSNLKHKTIIMTLYGTGVRMAELVGLTVKDIDSAQMVIHILGGKGNKDRNVQLSEVLLKQLRIYFKAYRPKVYLFEGQKGGKYSTTAVNAILRKAASRAGLNKRVSAHMIRHSYATHMMDKGVGIRYIQMLLGHKSSKTTEIYTHVSQKNIKNLHNPLDDLPIFVE